MQDNQPKHRQLAKVRAKAVRKQSGRSQSQSVLLVCEGECTEPFYLNGLLVHLGISAASAEIVAGQTDSDAVSVVKRARDRFEQNPRDRVFAVIDGEQKNLSQAMKLCETPVQRASRKSGRPEVRIEPIVSMPCFEVWFLLHFRFCDKPFKCFEDVRAALMQYLPVYSKRDPQIFAKLGGRIGLHRAMANTEKLRNSVSQTGASTPATDVDKLVKSLCELRSSCVNPLAVA